MIALSRPVTIRLHGISHSYDGSRLVLDDVSMEIRRGDRVAIVGPSGSGKTTLLAIIGLLTKPSHGSVELESSRDSSRDHLRRKHFGWIFQTSNALPRRTVLDNVILPLMADAAKVADARSVGLELLSQVGLEGLEGEPAYRLSGGELQRMGIARSLITSPPVLLADEPTGQLDYDTSMGVVGVLVRRLPSRTTLVVATHDDRVAAACDRVYSLENGVVIEQR